MKRSTVQCEARTGRCLELRLEQSYFKMSVYFSVLLSRAEN